jgi:hypothetical protein
VHVNFLCRWGSGIEVQESGFRVQRFKVQKFRADLNSEPGNIEPQNVEVWFRFAQSKRKSDECFSFDIHYSIFAFSEFLFSIKLAAFQANSWLCVFL